MLLLSLLLACPADPAPAGPPVTCDPTAAEPDAPAIVPGAPMAGVAEAILQLPQGTPLSGYTSRCGCFGGDGKVDRRDSAYTTEFAASAGVQTPIPLKAFWLSNGDQDLVILKVDLIYSFDGLVEEMERRLTAATGRNMDGKVVVSTNHSHNAYGDFSDQVTFYLGSDRFHYEVFTRVAEQAESVALDAYDGLQPVKIGVGYAKDWDPDDRVYRDRRDANDALQFFPDIPAGRYKDPNLTMLRVDTLDGAPLGVLFNFGIHGTSLDSDNAMVSVDAPGHVERVFEERFDTPVVVALLQGGAGDASPAGTDDGYANMETVGEYAADALYDLWSSIPLGSDPIRLETASRSVPETLGDIRVTRGGAVDLRYAPYDEDLEPDNQVYADDGSLLSPIDEFNVPYGAAFCGENPAYLPGFAPAEVFPYDQCVTVDKMEAIIAGFFDLEDDERHLPLLESKVAAVTATRFGPVRIREADGTETQDDFFVGFFPGEPTSMYTEQFRRRAASELGYRHSMAVGYSQDHEGYLLIPEDWLTGGYEIDINVWGPLQGEHIMEQLLTMADQQLSTDVVETQDRCGVYQPTDYGAWTMPTFVADLAPEAGTALSAKPDYLYSPLYTDEERDAGVIPEVTPPAELPRVQGLAEFAWVGGDPAVDYPIVTLERMEDDGSFATVLTQSGRPLRLGPDILLTHTPTPLYPPEAEQTHMWYAAWQAVGHIGERAGLPTGTYRLHVEGETWTGAGGVYPDAAVTEPYTVDSAPFDVVPATITLTPEGGDLLASIDAPARGYRLVDLAGSSKGANPLPAGAVSCEATSGDGDVTVVNPAAANEGARTRLRGALNESVVTVTCTDVFGNVGSWARVTAAIR